MNKSMSFSRFGETVLNYLAIEYDCESELDHSEDGVRAAKEFIKECYEKNMTPPDCCGELVRQVIRNSSAA